MAELVGADPGPHRDAAERIRDGLRRRLWDPVARRFRARDLRAGRWIDEESLIAFAPIPDPDLPPAMVDAICAQMESTGFHVADRADHFVVNTYDVRSPRFDARRYWRGPIWLNTNWLLWRGLRRHDRDRLADEIAAGSIGLIEGAGFREYFDPFGGAGHGSDDFAWSAALHIDIVLRGPSAAG